MSDPAKWLRELSEPWKDGEKVKSAIDRAAKLSGLTYWRAFDIWYRKARQIEGYEIEQIAAAIERKNERDGRNELQALKTQLARLEARLNAGDANFHSPSIAHAREMVRQLSDMGRPMAGRRSCVAS
jgi:hypothetical protein